MAFKNPLEQSAALQNATTNKYNLKPTKEIRPYRMGSLSQEVGSTYNNISDLYGVDLNDLVYGDKGFEKTRYPQGHPDFSGDIVYSEKLWDEFEDWAKKERGIDFNDRRWERYKLDPDYFEGNFDPDFIKQVREYGAKLEPQHEIHKRPLPERWWK